MTSIPTVDCILNAISTDPVVMTTSQAEIIRFEVAVSIPGNTKSTSPEITPDESDESDELVQVPIHSK